MLGLIFVISVICLMICGLFWLLCLCFNKPTKSKVPNVVALSDKSLPETKESLLSFIDQYIDISGGFHPTHLMMPPWFYYAHRAWFDRQVSGSLDVIVHEHSGRRFGIVIEFGPVFKLEYRTS